LLVEYATSNIAQDKPANQSGTFILQNGHPGHPNYAYNASLATNGDLTDFSLTHTFPHSWWAVDLGPSVINYIRIYNMYSLDPRAGCIGEGCELDLSNPDKVNVGMRWSGHGKNCEYYT